jgi:hypothetical protein
MSYRIGDIVAIPLPNGEFAYGKLHRDASIGIYDVVSDPLLPPTAVITKPFMFFSGIFDTAIKRGIWLKIGYEPFQDENSEWPPPAYIQDVIDPSKYRIYFKGQMTPAKQSEIHSLDKQTMRKPKQLVDEICRRLHAG